MMYRTFSVFAGANGSGKSNLFEALEFIKDVLKYGAKDAIRKHGGYDSIRSYKLKMPNDTPPPFNLHFCDFL